MESRPLDDASETITGLSQENLHQFDQMDRQIESNVAFDLRTRDRERNYCKIEAALRRIDDGSYGYCVETDEPISLRRLEALPIASLSLHAQDDMNVWNVSIATIELNDNLPPVISNKVRMWFSYDTWEQTVKICLQKNKTSTLWLKSN